MPQETTLENKLAILSQLWIEYRQEDTFKDFIEYNDLGLPLAYAIHNGIVSITNKATKFVDETFDLLLTALEVEDKGYEDLEHLLGDE
jgi:hypothetical protein